MSELQKIAIGLLGMTHPEVYRLRRRSSGEPTKAAGQGQNQRHASALLCAAKFAFAALVAGSRAIPLGDNGGVTRELGAYGAQLRSG
jgi:hypothetical protein